MAISACSRNHWRPWKFPHIAYYHGEHEDLRLADCRDAACASSVITTLDRQGDVGSYASLLIGPDGVPTIAYHDGWPNHDLKFVRPAL